MIKPPSGQGPFQQGERLTAAKLNEWVSKRPAVEVFGEGHAEGGIVAVDGRESMWIRLTEKDAANTPIKYGWKRVSRLPNGTWQNLTHTGNVTNDYAVEVNNASLTVNTTTVYRAERSVTTGEWLFQQTGNGSSSGNFTANSSETVLMILGDYEAYKDCPNVPGSPPTLTANFCTGETNSTLCVPAYAYAVYQRCGYIWNKIGDTRTYQVWANEMNGQSVSAWRRFVIPRWGGNITSGGAPSPEDACVGVAFHGSGVGSALSCSCPSCLSSPPANVTLCLRFRTIERPDEPQECADLVNALDAADGWGKQYSIELSPVSGYCSAGGSDPDNIFTVNWDFFDGSQLDPCDWGPDVFDPCDPCAHWGRLYAYIDVPGNNDPNCGGSGHWRGEFKARDVCNLLCNCSLGPITPEIQSFCDGCGNVSPPQFNVIEEGSIELICCSQDIPEPENLLAHYMPNIGQTSGSTGSWADQSGNGVNISQATAARVPSLTAIGGYNAFSFVDNTIDGTQDDYMNSAAVGLVNGKSGTTVFCVFQYDSAQTTFGGIFGVYSGSPNFAPACNLVMTNYSGTMYPEFRYRRRVSDSTAILPSTVALSGGNLYAVIGRVDFTNGSQKFDISANRTRTTGTAPTGTIYDFETGLNRHTLAGANTVAISTAPGFPCTVKILEGGVYDRALSDASLTQLEDYLMAKFGI